MLKDVISALTIEYPERREEMKKGRFVVNEPIISVNPKKLQERGVSLEELKRYFPRYIINPTPLYYSWVKRVWFGMIQWFLKVLVKIFLRPRRSSGGLDCLEVDEVYRKESATYNYKHHLTTRGMDLVWRRLAGWFVSSVRRNQPDAIKILDLCTGTGLTVKEILAISKEWGINVEVIGLDYNKEMLAIASDDIGSKVEFVRGDAMDLISGNRIENSADIVTQVFGIGGIPEPLRVFNGVLRILKPGGQFLMIDMHKPIPEHPGEWPFLLRWCRFPIFESVVYEQSTISIVLNRLWGWRDPTLCFYLLSLVTYQGIDGRNWGFEVQFFEQESQRWWFSLPVMPVAKIIVKKVEIDEKTARKRSVILESCVFSQ